MKSRGVLYVATGRKYLEEAIQSAASLRSCMPEIHITIFTDEVDRAQDYFSSIIPLRNPFYSQRDKIGPLLNSPYDKTLFLDTDTYICNNCEDIYDLLDRFEIAAAHAPARYRSVVPDCPDSFPELNSGVLAFVKSEDVIAALRDWQRLYEEQVSDNPRNRSDQSSLRKALYLSKVKFCVLPPEYNYRVNLPGFVGGFSDVKIMHGRRKNPVQTAAWLNSNRKIRIFLPGLSLERRSSFGILSRPGHMLDVFMKPFMTLLHVTNPLKRNKKKKKEEK